MEFYANPSAVVLTGLVVGGATVCYCYSVKYEHRVAISTKLFKAYSMPKKTAKKSMN